MHIISILFIYIFIYFIIFHLCQCELTSHSNFPNLSICLKKKKKILEWNECHSQDLDVVFQGKASSPWSQWTWAVSKHSGRGIAFGDEFVRRQQVLLQSGHYLAGRRLARPLVGHCQSGSRRRPGEPHAINQIDRAAAKLYTHTHALAHYTLLSLSRLSLCQL